MRSILIFGLLLLCPGRLAAQSKEKPREVKGTYEEFIPKHLSQAEAEQEFIRLARRNALTEAFGVGAISTVDKQYTDWRTRNGAPQVDERFFSETEAYSAGRWVTDTHPTACQLSLKDGKQYLACKVRGKAVPIIRAPITFDARLLKCMGDELTCATKTLQSGQPFYLSFQAPVTGYLTVFVQYQSAVQQLLPYAGMEEASLRTKRDQSYLLFSKARAGDLPTHLVTEYEAYTDTEKSFEKIILVFSEKRYGKPGGMQPQSESSGSKKMPLQTTAKKFGQWLQRAIALDPGIQVENIYYTIVK